MSADPLEELDVDVRVASVIWTDDETEPEVSFSGCSKPEAIGLLVVGIRDLLFLDDEDDEDE